MSIEEILERNAKFRAERRAKMPQCCEIEKAFKDVFGADVQVTYASENGCVVGKPGPEGVVPNIPKPIEEKKDGQRNKGRVRR